jgi:hypothetical protein
MSSGANFIMEVLTTEPSLCNPESHCSKCISIFTKLFLKPACNFVSIDSIVQEKSDDHSLIIFHLKRALGGLSDTKWENNYGINRILESNLIYLTFWKVYTLEIKLREMRTPELSAGGWRMCMLTTRSLGNRRTYFNGLWGSIPQSPRRDFCTILSAG